MFLIAGIVHNTTHNINTQYHHQHVKQKQKKVTKTFLRYSTIMFFINCKTPKVNIRTSFTQVWLWNYLLCTWEYKHSSLGWWAFEWFGVNLTSPYWTSSSFLSFLFVCGPTAAYSTSAAGRHSADRRGKMMTGQDC